MARPPPKPTLDNTARSPDGIPDIPTRGAPLSDNGICSTCLMPARVALHKRGGYFSACRNCGTRVFTSTAEGALVFRAMQRTIQDGETRAALQDALKMELAKLMVELTPMIHTSKTK